MDRSMPNAPPRLSIGLPVYNAENYLSEALEALLNQSYSNFELIISDNASTDRTEEICRQYLARDPRIRYIRHPVNRGAGPNHNFVVEQAQGEFFKWASHDDLYGPQLLMRCIQALDEHPKVVLAHAWEAFIDAEGKILRRVDYRLKTDSPRASDRFKSTLLVRGGDDFYGVMRTSVLRRTPLHGSYHHADRTLVAELSLHGPFYQVPEVLYFRRDHPRRAEREKKTKRARAANLDPRRADRLRNPLIRLLIEYVWGYVGGIQRAEISTAERLRCYGHLARWLLTRSLPGASRRAGPSADPALQEGGVGAGSGQGRVISRFE